MCIQPFYLPKTATNRRAPPIQYVPFEAVDRHIPDIPIWFYLIITRLVGFPNRVESVLAHVGVGPDINAHTRLEPFRKSFEPSAAMRILRPERVSFCKTEEDLDWRFPSHSSDRVFVKNGFELGTILESRVRWD